MQHATERGRSDVSLWTSRAWRAVDAVLGRPSRRERYRALVARYARGRTFADVGCMWRVHGDYCFHALDAGATAVSGVDVMAPTPEFLARNAARGGAVRYVQGDVNDPALVAEVGPVDVVLCAGVLYHMPNPLLTLGRLRRLCTTILLLGSVVVPERHGRQRAVFLPFLDARAARALGLPREGPKVAVDSAFRGAADYGNWFWGFTPSCVAALVRAAGFEVLEAHALRSSICLVCRPAEAGAA